LELARRLEELNVKQESLFLWCEDTQPATLWSLDRWEESVLSSRDSDEHLYSAFTVAELGEILPCEVWKGKKAYWFNSAAMSHGWATGYVSRAGEYRLLNDHQEIENTEADARAKMLIYLVQNKLVTLSENS
jgi:hypothetical protein